MSALLGTVWQRAATVILLALISSIAFAQTIQLSPDQQRMLDQLPPAQRQQAMDAIRQMQSQQAAPTQQSINEMLTRPDARGTGDAELDEDEDEEPRAESRSRVIITFELGEELTPAVQRELDEDPIMQRLMGSHLFVLDDLGVLSLQGLNLIPLLGLTEEDIVRRLEAEPYLRTFSIDARILGQVPIGVEALEPFGYDAFEPREAIFEPPTSGPVPSDYVLGPGDSVRVQLFGNVNGIYEYEVTRDGILNLPEIGPVTVAGIPFSEFRKDLNERVKQMLIGTQVSVTMGQLRTIRVFVLGDANQPGSYVVSGLASIAGALYRGGGVSEVGSLRNIQLKRNGRVVETLDLYDLLLKGDTSSDTRLQPGDVVFVPPLGDTISIAGAVKRPAIYEIRGRATIADAVRLAGGLAPDADASGAVLERINGDRLTMSVDLSDASASAMPVRAGDTLVIPEVLPSLENTVVLAGHVYRPGNVQWRPGMRLTDLIQSADVLKPGVDMEYVLIRRERERGQPIEAVSANLSAALRSPGGPDDLLLVASDTVHVFSLALGRQRVVDPLLEELRLQATIDSPAQEVQISGDVRAPGVYPLEDQMRVSDLIRAGGNLAEAAYALEAELTRYSVSGSDERTIEVVNVDLDSIRRGVESDDLMLREHDYLIINRVPEWDATWTVSLEGEVRFPGEYRVRQGEILEQVLQRAGGLTDKAFAEGAVFLREGLKNREKEQIDTLARRMEADLASLALQAAESGGSDALSRGQVLLDQLRSTEPVGRLVIDMQQNSNIEMRDGDRLLVPTMSQVVTVMGETQQNTSHLYQESLSRDDYINSSGGLTRRADKKLIYVVRANGAVIAGSGSKWIGRGGKTEIRPGDTIVVPLDTDRMRPLAFWGSVTQILYQAAIAVAAVNSF